MHLKKGILWFRQDLRLHDNEALLEALHYCDEVIPVYVFDERVFKGKTPSGFPKTGKYRARFIMESVQNLRENIRARGSELIIRIGKPEIELFKIARSEKTSWIFCNRERTDEEVKVQDALEKKLWSIGQEMRYCRGKMLYYTADLPFPVTHTPDIFSAYRKEVEKIVEIREPLRTEEMQLRPIPDHLERGEIPTLSDLGHSEFLEDPRAVVSFQGGETEGINRLFYYFKPNGPLYTYADTRNNFLGGDYSTKFSPWLSQGCLSPKMIYKELGKFEKENGRNESTHQLFIELLWRDFFRLMGKKHLNSIFKKGGPKGIAEAELKNDYTLLDAWIEGKTGVPFIDANMRELKATGFMSNRGRQNAASFLVNDLRVNWQLGAEYFESVLIDYDPCSNWGNWNYAGGVGSDLRENRSFNVLSQATRHDPQGEYVKLWVPELTKLPYDKIHEPHELSSEEQEIYGVTMGIDYPYPVLSYQNS